MDDLIQQLPKPVYKEKLSDIVKDKTRTKRVKKKFLDEFLDKRFINEYFNKNKK